jgi:actin B, putative
MAQRKVYYIPDNFVDDEKIFGGKFRKRNFIEAVIFTLPVLGLFWLINWATGIGWGTLFYPTFLFGIATFFLFIIGYNGDSWGETLLLAQKFRSNKFNISTYNPRVKTELTADYLANPNANSKAEAIRNFIKNLNDVLAGARGQSEIADDLTSDKTILWYVEDEGIIEKPESLKTAAEIKQEEKDAKKAAKLEKKKQKEYLSTLGPKERKIAKARFKAQALEKAERDRKRREEELRIYNEAIAKREKEEAEKAKEEQTLSQLEKDKESNKKLSARQAAAQRRAEIKKLRRENTLREKEEAKAAKKKAKEDALAKKQAEKEAEKKTSPKKKQVTQNKAGVAAAPSVQQKEEPKKPLLINLDKVSKKEKQQATQQTAAPSVQEQKPQKSQKSAIDNILKKEAKKKEEPAKEEKQAESKTEAIKPEKKEPAIVPVVKASSVQEQTTEKPTHQPVKAPQKEEVTVTDSKKADVREVPDLLDSHNVFYGIGASQGNEFVLDDDEKGGNSL